MKTEMQRKTNYKQWFFPMLSTCDACWMTQDEIAVSVALKKKKKQALMAKHGDFAHHREVS